jgi:hypothetical protein
MLGRLRLPRSVKREHHYRIDRQLILLVNPRKVAEHSLTELLPMLSLTLDVNQKERFFPFEPGSHDEVGLMPLACGYVGEDFFVKEHYGFRVNVRTDVGEE